MSRVLGPLSPTGDAPTVRGFVAALLLVEVTTLLIAALISVVHVERIVGVYVIPVLIAAIRWGLWPGILAAFTGVAMINLVFTRTPLGFQLQDWDQVVRLFVYIMVAVIASRLARSVKDHAESAERAINETRRRAETDHCARR